jgi:hypothetical protein
VISEVHSEGIVGGNFSLHLNFDDTFYIGLYYLGPLRNYAAVPLQTVGTEEDISRIERSKDQ